MNKEQQLKNMQDILLGKQMYIKVEDIQEIIKNGTNCCASCVKDQLIDLIKNKVHRL